MKEWDKSITGVEGKKKENTTFRSRCYYRNNDYYSNRRCM